MGRRRKNKLLKKGETIDEINKLFKDAIKNKGTSRMTLNDFAELDNTIVDGDNLATDAAEETEIIPIAARTNSIEDLILGLTDIK